MVVVKLKGGLGNQMFQYAAGLSLAVAINTTFKIDLSFFKKAQDGLVGRSYLLDKYQISADIAGRTEVDSFLDRTMVGRLKNFISRGKGRGASILKEKYFHYNPGFMEVAGDVYLDGYWQSEKYFPDIRNLLLKEFSLCQPLTGQNREVADLINSCASVSIHVRRGDYVSCAKTAAFHGICPIEYYQRSIATVLHEVRGAEFFVFSDDPVWVREHIYADAPIHFIDHNAPERAEEDLRLFSLCRHHIIANSSFSWWGAWLSQNPEKKVFAPNHWFADPSINTSDLIPVGWRRI